MANHRSSSKSRKQAGAAAAKRDAVRVAHSTHSVTNAREQP